MDMKGNSNANTSDGSPLSLRAMHEQEFDTNQADYYMKWDNDVDSVQESLHGKTTPPIHAALNKQMIHDIYSSILSYYQAHKQVLSIITQRFIRR